MPDARERGQIETKVIAELQAERNKGEGINRWETNNERIVLRDMAQYAEEALAVIGGYSGTDTFYYMQHGARASQVKAVFAERDASHERRFPRKE